MIEYGIPILFAYAVLDAFLMGFFENFSDGLNFFRIILFPILLLVEGLFRLLYPVFQHIKSTIKEIY